MSTKVLKRKTAISQKILEVFNQKKTPFIIRRYLPNNEYEDWRLSEMIY